MGTADAIYPDGDLHDPLVQGDPREGEIPLIDGSFG
jgi:hypothetical protein